MSVWIMAVLGCDQAAKVNDADTGAPTDSAWSELDAQIESEMTRGRIPGLGVALIADGQVVLARGYGWADIEGEVPVTAQTPFMLASISKTVTGLAVMQAVESEAMGLDQPISDLVPFDIDNPHTQGEVITARHLMTHTSGIRDRWAVWGALGEADALYTQGDSEISLAEVMEGYLSATGEWYDESNYVDALPGEAYRYCNMATALAGHLVELSTTTSLDDHSDAQIFAPLGMTHTGWHLADHDVAQVAIPYQQVGETFLAYGHYGYPDYPDGQLRSSAADMARYLLAMDLGGALDGVRVLSEAGVDEMFSPQIPDVEDTQGLFWYQSTGYGRELIGHDGGDYGVATMMLLDPVDGTGIVVLANADWTQRASTAIDNIGRILFDVGRSQ